MKDPGQQRTEKAFGEGPGELGSLQSKVDAETERAHKRQLVGFQDQKKEWENKVESDSNMIELFAAKKRKQTLTEKRESNKSRKKKSINRTENLERRESKKEGDEEYCWSSLYFLSRVEGGSRGEKSGRCVCREGFSKGRRRRRTAPR